MGVTFQAWLDKTGLGSLEAFGLMSGDLDPALLRSTNPGRIVYEDAVQVLVEGWNRLSR